LGVSPECFICLYAGTMGLISGIAMLADTARRIIDRKDIIILCVGEGVAKDSLQINVADLGLSNVIFLPFQPADQLNAMLAAADIGIVTLLPASGKSSNPSKVLGYMSAGRPVLASVADDSATAEIIRAGKCGWVVPCQDSSAMADAICQAADNRENTLEAGRRAREYAVSNFSRKGCVDIFRRALEGRLDRTC
jgi:colanic acid biosynthesis glycosyl transferase WcaI